MARTDPVARRFGLYTAYPLPPTEFVGSKTAESSEQFLRERLRASGYHHQWLAATKSHPETGDMQDIGCRKVPGSHPDIDTRLTRNWAPNQCQFHVHLWHYGGRVEVFSHYELRPDFFSPTFNRERLREHYRPTWGETYLPGVCDFDVEIGD